MKIRAALLASGLILGSISAQEKLIPVETAVVPEQFVGLPGPDLPAPPKGLFDTPPKHGMPEIPLADSGLPQPTDGPVAVLTEEPGIAAGDTYTVFRNANVKPSGSSTSNVDEPDVTLADSNNLLYTHNWSAARSSDGGQSWSRINPYTRFPASYGGFCCDQVVASRGATTVWLLQYVKNASGNTQRVAVATSPGNVGADSFARYYDITAATFGYAASDWLDYPDVAATDTHFYFTTNVFSSGNSFRGAVIWRATIANFQAGGGLGIGFINSSGGARGASFRLVRGATDTMYVGSHVNTSQMRIQRWRDADSSFSQVERDVPAWSGGGLSAAPGPDGRNWTGRADNRITGGFASEDGFGFAWHSNSNGSSRLRPYVRVQRFNNDLSVGASRDVWNSTFGLAYPSAATNAWGHLALVAGIGGGSIYPSTCTLIEDDVESFASARLFASSSVGPLRDVWGDYLACDRHPDSAQYGTFYGSGFRTPSGGDNGDVVPEYIHFGREAFGSSFVGLVVRSVPSGANITLTADASGNGSGTAPFIRGYTASSSYTATAPSTRSISGNNWLFDRWYWKSVANEAWRAQSVGALSTTQNIASIDDGIEARYLQERVLTIRSTNPSSGTVIAVSPADFFGAGNGGTTFTRRYKDGTGVSLTAPAAVGCNPFDRWVLDGNAQAAGNRTLAVTMDAAHTAIAQYRSTTIGTISNLGAGCPGSNGQIPVQTVTHNNGSCGPQLGTTTSINLRATANSLGVLQIGLRTDSFNGLRLPLDLSLIQMPGCFLFHDIIIGEGMSTNGLGTYSLNLRLPVDRNGVGVRIHTTFAVVDARANRTGVIHSNAMTTRHGATL